MFMVDTTNSLNYHSNRQEVSFCYLFYSKCNSLINDSLHSYLGIQILHHCSQSPLALFQALNSVYIRQENKSI